MADLAQLRHWLTEAEAARHSAMLGKRVVDVWVMEYGRTRYGEASLADLDAYIKNLKDQIEMLDPNIHQRRGPVRLLW